MDHRPALATLSWALPVAAGAASLTVSVSDAGGQPLQDAVVAVQVAGEPAVAAPGTRAELAQRQRAFDPGVLPVQTGTAVYFPNFDTVRHHVYSFSPIKPFEIKLYAGTPAAPTVFDKPGVAVLGCNIHDRMLGHVVVVDTPHFARTDARGQATLLLPPGEHQLSVWHAILGDGPMLRQKQVLADGAASVQVQLKGAAQGNAGPPQGASPPRGAGGTQSGPGGVQ